MENNNTLSREALKWGLILGLIQIVIETILYIADKELLVSMWIGLSQFVVNLLFFILAVRSVRTMGGELISFKDALLTILFVVLASMTLTTVFTWLLYNVIDPELATYVKEKAIEKTIGMMEKFGAPQESIDQTVAKMEEEDFSMSISRTIKQYLGGILFQMVIGLIVAAIMKKKPNAATITNE